MKFSRMRSPQNRSELQASIREMSSKDLRQYDEPVRYRTTAFHERPLMADPRQIKRSSIVLQFDDGFFTEAPAIHRRAPSAMRACR